MSNVYKVLIIGSMGFIGKHMYAQLLQEINFECWACDVVTDYTDERYYIIDSSNSDFNEIFSSVSFDFCINCSGAASVQDSLKHPLRDFALNTYNVAKILDAIRKHAPFCRFINLSSAAVYGNPVLLPISEDFICKPISPYGQHKLMAEQLCEQYYNFFGIRTCSLRIFSAYGPGLQKQLLWDLYQKSIKSDCVTMFGTGEETRDFIFVSDIVKAVFIIMHNGDFNGNAYNVASGTETSIRKVASIMLQLMNYEGSLEFSGKNRSGDPINWRADTNRLVALGYSAEISIENGIYQYLKWIRENVLG